MSNQWLDVIAHPPEIGAWALVLCDRWSEEMGTAEALTKFLKQERYKVRTAVMYGRDLEGWPCWNLSWDGVVRHKLSSDLYNVTHYMLLPKPLPDDSPVPEWCTWDTPQGMYAS